MDVNRTATAIATKPELNRVSGGELNGVVLSAATWLRETEKIHAGKAICLKTMKARKKQPNEIGLLMKTV